MTTPNFYMVFVEGCSSPALKHNTHAEAMAEAQRLCVKTGFRAYVLVSDCHCDPAPKVVWCKPANHTANPRMASV